MVSKRKIIFKIEPKLALEKVIIKDNLLRHDSGRLNHFIPALQGSKLCVPGPTEQIWQADICLCQNWHFVLFPQLYFPEKSTRLKIFTACQMWASFPLSVYFSEGPFFLELGDHFHLIKAIERKVAKDMANMALINPFFCRRESSSVLVVGGWLVEGFNFLPKAVKIEN